MHFVGTSLLGGNTRALHRPLNQVANVDIDDATPGSSQMSIVALRNCGSLLRSRNGSLEQAFNVLDADSTGQLTLEAFTKGMERFGSSPEDARNLFQQMDILSTGFVGMPAFLAALKDETELGRSMRPEDSRSSPREDIRIHRLEAQTVEMQGFLNRLEEAQDSEKLAAKLTPLLAIPENLGARLLRLEALPDVMSLAQRLTDLEALVKESSKNNGLSEEIDAVRKALVDETRSRDAQDQVLQAECESIKLQYASQLQEATKRVGSVVVEELQTKLDVIRVQLQAQLQDATAAQVQGEVASFKDSATDFMRRAERLEAQCEAHYKDFGQRTQALEARCEQHCTTQLDLLKQRLESQLLDMRSEWRAEVQANTMAKANERRELEHSATQHAVAEARSAAMSVTTDMLIKELEPSRKEVDSLRTETSQYVERLAVVEDHLKMLRMEVDRIQTLCSAASRAQGMATLKTSGIEVKDVDVSESAEVVASLESKVKDVDVRGSAEVVASLESKVSEMDVRFESRVLSMSQHVQKLHTSMRTEITDLRAEFRRLISVDFNNMLESLQKLQTQSDDSCQRVDDLAKLHSEAWQKESETRCFEDKRVESKLGTEIDALSVRVAAITDDVKVQAGSLSELSKGLRSKTVLGQQVKRPPISNVLQDRLKHILNKMDNKCIEDLGPDLKMLSSLLAEEDQPVSQSSSEKADEDMLSFRCPLPDPVGSAPLERSTTPIHPPRSLERSTSPASQGRGLLNNLRQSPDALARAIAGSLPSSVPRGPLPVKANVEGFNTANSVASAEAASTASVGEARNDERESAHAMNRLRDDILSYLHYEFQDMLSNTLKQSWPSQAQQGPQGSFTGQDVSAMRASSPPQPPRTATMSPTLASRSLPRGPELGLQLSSGAHGGELSSGGRLASGGELTSARLSGGPQARPGVGVVAGRQESLPTPAVVRDSSREQCQQPLKSTYPVPGSMASSTTAAKQFASTDVKPQGSSIDVSRGSPILTHRRLDISQDGNDGRSTSNQRQLQQGPAPSPFRISSMGSGKAPGSPRGSMQNERIPNGTSLPSGGVAGTVRSSSPIARSGPRGNSTRAPSATSNSTQWRTTSTVTSPSATYRSCR